MAWWKLLNIAEIQSGKLTSGDVKLFLCAVGHGQVWAALWELGGFVPVCPGDRPQKRHQGAIHGHYLV